MLEKLYKSFFFSYSRFIFLGVLISTIFFSFKALKLKIDASSDTLILENDTDLKYFQTISKRYKSPDFLVIAYTPYKNLLSEDVIKSISSMTDELENINSINSVISILNVPLLESSKKGLADILEGVPILKDSIVGKKEVELEFTNSALYKNNLVSEDFSTTAILINLKDNKKLTKLREKKKELQYNIKNQNVEKEVHEELKNISRLLTLERDKNREVQAKLIYDVRKVISKYKSTGEIFLGGIPMIANDVVAYVKADLKVFGITIFLFLILALSIIFKQIRWVLMPIITCFFSVVITSGLFSIFNWEVTVISSNYISLQLILTMAITIHLIIRYRELALKKEFNTTQEHLLLNTVKQMIKPCFFTVITTIAGFSSLILSGLLPVINFGWMMSVGVSISLILTFIMFPILLKELKVLNPNISFERKFNLPKFFSNFTAKYSRVILLSSLGIFIFSAYGISKLKVENSFIDYFKSSTEINKGMKVIDQKLGGTTLLDVTLDFDNLTNKNIDNNKKENIIEEKGSDFLDEDDLFLELESDLDDPKYWFTKDRMLKIEKLHDYLDSIEQTGKVLSFATILKIGKKLNNNKPLDSVQLALLYEKLPLEYKKIILDPYISPEHNQARVTLRVKDSDPNLRRNDLINKIKQEVPVLLEIDQKQIRLSNILILYNNMLQSLFSSQILTLGLVVAVLFSMFLILFRSFKLSFIALLPNLLSIGTVLGLMGVLGIPLDMMTITIAAISMGIAVDNTIHYIFRYKIEYLKTKDYISAMKRTHSSIGYALYYTTLTIIVGFSILVFSNFIPSIYFGLLTSLAMLIALIASLTLVPKLISLVKPY